MEETLNIYAKIQALITEVKDTPGGFPKHKNKLISKLEDAAAWANMLEQPPRTIPRENPVKRHATGFSSQNAQSPTNENNGQQAACTCLAGTVDRACSLHGISAINF